ncbi:MAG: phosphoenolpyruvate--protein phosphotransferase [Pseudomonadota bacterium]
MRDAVASEASAQERLDHLTRVIAGHVVADVCSIYLRRDSDLELFSTEGLKRDAVHVTKLPVGEGLVGVVAQSQAPLVTDDAPSHDAFRYFPDIGEEKLLSFLGVPLIRSGKTLGVLVVQNVKKRTYTDEEVEAVQAVATLLAEITASGELLEGEESAAVEAMLHGAERLEGVSVAPGIAIGKAVFREAPAARHRVFSRDSHGEAARLERALDDLRQSVDQMIAGRGLGGESLEILEAYRLFAYDRGWKDRLRAAVFSGLTAEAAVEQVQSENRTRLARAQSAYLRERVQDLEDLSNRLMRRLSGEDIDAPRELPGDAVVIARTMGPAELLEYDRDRLRGVVLSEASTTSHVAIVARALEVPIVASVDDALDLADEGDAVVVDGETGVVHLRPTREIADSYRQQQGLRSERQAAFAREAGLPAVTQDGVEVEIHMNAGLAVDMRNLAVTGAAGVGLFRTELQFLIGRQLPRVSDQERFYRDILARAEGRPVVFRTADLGADKSAAYMKRRREANPAMGWRGLRMAVDRPGIVRPQLRALIAAAAGRDLYVMFPMVTLPSELEAARGFIDQEIAFAEAHGKDLPRKIAVGAMVETPAAAWRARALARHADFLSIGGNDLAQFYFAADRDSDLTQRRFDPIDEGFLTFLKHCVDEAAAGGAPVSYCGEQVADTVTAAALLAVGVRRFSIPATAVGPFRRMVRSVSLEAISAALEAAYGAGGGAGGPVRPAFRASLEASGAALN